MTTSEQTTTTGEPFEFDPVGPVFFRDPTDLYRRLRDEAPVYFSERYGFWALSRWEDVSTAHRDVSAFLQQFRDRPPLPQ